MSELSEEVARAATRAVDISRLRGGDELDFSEASLSAIEEMLEEASTYLDQMTAKQQEMLVSDFGSYVLEVARLAFGGEYQWMDKGDQPVLIVGEPLFHIALVTWDIVRSRLCGDTAHNIPFFYSGFAERVRNAKPGSRALYV